MLLYCKKVKESRGFQESSNGGVISGHSASTFSWVFCQGGVWMAMEVWTW